MKFFGKSILLSYAQVFFSYSPYFGACLLLATFFNPSLGLGGLLAIVIANASATFMRYNREHIESGYYGVNALLVGLEIAYFYKLNFASISLLVILVVSTVLLTSALGHLYKTYFRGNFPRFQ